MNERALRRLFRRVLAVSVPVTFGVAACGGGTEESGSANPGGDAQPASDADAGFCGDDRPPEMRNYPGCAPPFCLPILDAGADAEAGSDSDAATDANAAVEAAAASDAAPQSICQILCGPTGRPVVSCTTFSYEGTSYVKCQTDCTGRRPPGFAPERRGALDRAGTHFAEMARLEAASIAAFRLLARELGLHGAPRSLRRAARRAARDEVAHTRAIRALAERFGSRVELPRIPATAPRPLEAVALENAVEGCVRETFGALIAARQAKAANDPVVRRAMARIARDELRHAALAWRVARWSNRRLAPASREHVSAALVRAVRELCHDLEGEAPPGLAHLAGLPAGAELRRMAGELARELWAVDGRAPIPPENQPAEIERSVRNGPCVSSRTSPVA